MRSRERRLPKASIELHTGGYPPRHESDDEDSDGGRYMRARFLEDRRELLMNEPEGGEELDTRLARFERLTEVPMLVLSLVFLGDIVAPVIDTSLSSSWRHALALAGSLIWAIFVAEFGVRFWLARRRLHFVTHNLLDLVVVVVPVLRPLRLARLARVARFARAGALAGSATRRSRDRLHVDVAVQVVTVAVIIVFIGAVGILDVERNARGSNIHSFGDALWWALSTVTTVGYGDRYPVTGQGRLIAAAVMLTGIAVLGVVTASVAGWFVANLRAVERQEEAEMAASARIEQRLVELAERMARLEVFLNSTPAPIARPEGTDLT